MTLNPNRLVDVRQVRMRFDDRVILDGVDLSIDRGEIVTLIGPNGAGKSTLVRIALGLMTPQEGSVIRAPDVRIGYTPQSIALDQSMPLGVRRFLMLAGGFSRNEIAAALDEVGAGRLINSQVHALSGGEMRRVLLARALLRDPDLLVLDEPTAGVDVAGQADVFDLIQKIRDRRGCGVLLVSHDLHLVMAATNRVICLNHHVCCAGHPEDVRKHPEYLSLFGPEIANGIAVYTHHHDHHHELSGEIEPHDHG